MLEFAGAALPMSGADIAAVAQQLGAEPALIAAVAEVESAGAGFLPDKRPKILFEAHVFGRETEHRFDRDHPNISSPSWDRGLYGAPGAHQYDRLHQAIALDRIAALRSASWGKFQILGMNFAACGFPNVEAFVAAMCESERAHLDAFVAFCRTNDLLRYLIVHDWRAFTRGYNGPGQVERYSALIAQAYARHAARATAGQSSPVQSPIEKIKAIQEIIGTVPDGRFGRHSREKFNVVLAAAGQPGI